nr:hypothetical protein CFP56_66171 [Quercus suber]
MIQEVDVSRSLPVTTHKLLVPRRPFGLGVTRQHALNTDTDALNIVHGAPALRVQQIEADYAVGVDVGVQRHTAQRWSGRRKEDYFRSFDGVRRGKVEAESEVLIGRVQRIVRHPEDQRGGTLYAPGSMLFTLASSFCNRLLAMPAMFASAVSFQSLLSYVAFWHGGSAELSTSSSREAAETSIDRDVELDVCHSMLSKKCVS